MRASYQIIISPVAAADLEAIYEFVARDSPGNASILVERILNAIERLGSFPHRTVAVPRRDTKRSVRSLPMQPYVVYFRVDDPSKTVRILTVRHGARRKPKRFS